MIVFIFLVALVSTCTAYRPGFQKNREIVTSSSSAITVNVGYFNQKLDHLNLMSNVNFTQRYLYSDHYTTNKKLALLLISEETSFEAGFLTDESSQIAKNAQRFGATTFALEHRFYGDSKPFPYLNSTSLRYLSSLQAIFDISEFINYANKQFNFDSDVKWVLFGIGYGGVLAAEARKVFPNQITGVIASSAPVKHVYDFWQYNDQVAVGIENIGGDNCVANISQAFKDVANLMTTVEGRANLSDAFRLNPRFDQTNLTANDIQSFYASIMLPIQQVVQFNNEFGVQVSRVCNIMANNNYTSIQNLYLVNNYVFSGQEPIFSSYSQVLSYYTDVSSTSQYSEARISFWQRCTEFGFFFTTNSDNTNSIFGAILPSSYFVNLCMDIFPDASISATTIRDAVETYNSFYGAADDYSGTNVVFTNGWYDPMGRMGKTTSKDISVVIFLIAEASYGADMLAGNGTTLYIEQAHAIATDNINTWFNNPPNPVTFVNTTNPWTRPQGFGQQSVPVAQFSALPEDRPTKRQYPKSKLNKKVLLGRPPHGFKPAPDGNELSDLPVGFEQGTFRQRVDHFDNTNSNYFQQKYFKNSQWAKPNGPNFLMIGGEGPESARWVLNENITYLTWAQKYGATVYLLEHRYYGDSIVGDNSNLQWLNSLQMLYDLADFIRAVNRKSTTQAPWITFGGSYSGAMSAWMREVFPDLVIGAVASSGPVYAKTDFYEYLMVVETSIRTYNSTCADNIKAGFDQMRILFNTKEGRANLSTLFTLKPAFGDTIRDVDKQYFFSTIYSNFQGAVQYSGDNTGPYAYGYGIPDMCNIMLNSTNTPIQNIANFNVFMTTFYNGGFGGTDNLYEDMVDDIKNAQQYGPDSAAGLLWTWQTCTEFGYFQSSDSGNGIFGSACPVNMFVQLCEDVFNDFNRASIDGIIDYTNYRYGSRNQYRGTNVVFPNGNVDPWHALGLYTYGEDTIVPYLIDGTAHCADMYPARPEDVPGLKIVRDLVDTNIAQWLAQYNSGTVPPTSTTTTTVIPGTQGTGATVPAGNSSVATSTTTVAATTSGATKMKCSICDSSATSLHFGAPSCKACAAFFRRTVALDITYECITGKMDCEVNFERRMACKHCRYEKCIKNNMKRDMVQSKKGRYEAGVLEREDSPCTSSASEEVRKFIDHIVKMDSNLNKSRRMAFTDSTLFDIFSGTCKMPFEKHQLRPFDFRFYNGYQKQEYVMMFNYSNAMPDFQQLSNADQNFLFRIACGVDFVMSSAFYTYCIGIENNLLISHDGTYIQMLPLPLSGDEPGAASMFPKKDEFEKYKNLVRPKVKSWLEFVPSFVRMEFTFEENALLKALCCWHMVYFNFDEAGKEICNNQKTKIMQSILQHCQDKRGEEEGAIRAGEIALFVSLINDEVMELVSTLIIMSFFEIMEGDTLIQEILRTSSLFS
ncbi:unnamed protein product [Caenorhabditis angaria]|uniref:Nuclear receptor domain-containing protein n=1 Tax=Caenorhabditis angaria TaxID=860376 RepID=A0A9P1IM19_9PELO|nr:unnamed protein product [Caenorhabditis angaria]